MLGTFPRVADLGADPRLLVLHGASGQVGHERSLLSSSLVEGPQYPRLGLDLELGAARDVELGAHRWLLGVAARLHKEHSA